MRSATADVATRCRWLQSAIDRHESDAQLARLVLSRMTLGEKLGEIVLVANDGYENIDAGVPRLCIPALTLQDGPAGRGLSAPPASPSCPHRWESPPPSTPAWPGPTARSRAMRPRVWGSTSSRVPTSTSIASRRADGPTRVSARILWLVSAMGVADIEGIQSTGTMAMAKHFAVYSQETDRGVLDDMVSDRALQEIYLPPFEAAVTQAHVASIMCAYPKLNGTYQCQDPELLSLLAQWGFTGFVRSDLGSVHDPVAALDGRHRPDQAVPGASSVDAGPRAPALPAGGGQRRDQGADRDVRQRSGGSGPVGIPRRPGRLRRPHRLRPARRRTVGGTAEERRTPSFPSTRRPSDRWP